MGFKLEVGVDNNPIQYNNPMDYKLGYELALTSTLTYKRKLVISMVYKYKANSIEFKNNRVLLKVY